MFAATNASITPKLSIMKRTDLASGIYLLEGFLSRAICQQLIDYAEQCGFEEAMVNVGNGQQRMVKEVRNNQRVIVKDFKLAEQLWQRAAPMITETFPMNRVASSPEAIEFAAQGRAYRPISVNEMFRYYKYEMGERFNRHRDGSYVRTTTERSHLTFMVYLNEDFEGGETEFDDLTVVPKTGDALLFHHPIKHTGCEVTKGVKYALRSDIMFSCD
jgi:prolyl 4-hydroxylase